jgi:hypothetical protein
MTQPQEDAGRQTQLVEVDSRQIVVREMTDMQKLLMTREARQLTRESVESERKLAAAATILDLLESVIVQPDDVEFIKQRIIEGKFELGDMMAFLKAFAPTEPAAPRVRRGRPRKSVAR